MRDIESKLAVLDGNTYRSILERKWALFFNYLRIEFKYEPERFDDGTQSGYLPDFVIYDQLFIEIKPTYEIAMRELKKPHEFAKRTNKRLLVVIGDPPGFRMLAVVKEDNGSIQHNDLSWIAWNTLEKKTNLDVCREVAAVNYVENEIDNRLYTPIARCLKKLGYSRFCKKKISTPAHRMYKP